VICCLTGCGEFGGTNSSLIIGSPGNGNSMGVTPGGAQDLTYIRSLIEDGQIPNSEMFYVEGIFSEYDLPVEGEVVDRTINVNSSYGYAAHHDIPGNGLFIQLGFSSNIVADEFHRESLNLSIVFDKSGSMSGEKIEIAKGALHNVVDQLDENDMLSIVLFNHQMSVLQEPVFVEDRESLHGLINTISANGSTNMELGMNMGYDYVRQSTEEGHNSHRVILMTDALPNTGNTGPNSFKEIVEGGAGENIGLTAIGVGLDFDQELIQYIATQKGGNYFYLGDAETADQLFEAEFDYMVTPVAYNMSVNLYFHPSYPIAAAYGFPGDEGQEASMDIATLFLSNRRGAILFQLDTPDSDQIIVNGTNFADIALVYEDPDGNSFSQDFSIIYNGETITSITDEYFDQAGVNLAVTLAREIITMKDACSLYSDASQDEAIAKLNSLVTFLEQKQEYFMDEDIQQEIDMVNKLIENMD
jgi:Ca-activated chloride channel homolog